MNKIKIIDEEKLMFNSLYELSNNKISFDADDGSKVDSESILDNFIRYLALKYKFDPNNFTIYDSKGKFIHTRVERPKPSVN